MSDITLSFCHLHNRLRVSWLRFRNHLKMLMYAIELYLVCFRISKIRRQISQNGSQIEAKTLITLLTYNNLI